MRILPSDRQSVASSSVSDNDSVEAARKIDAEEAEVQMKMTTKRLPLLNGPFNPEQAKHMGDHAAKIAAELIDIEQGSKAKQIDESLALPPTSITTSGCGSGSDKAATSMVDGESKDNA